MISVNFELFKFGRSFGKPGFDFSFYKRLTRNKNIEIQFTKFEITSLLDFRLNLYWWGQDHAGPKFNIEILGIYFGIDFYDSRHWDWHNGKWEIHERNL